MDSEKAHTSIVRDESLDTQMGHLANAEDHDTNKFGAIRKYPWAFAWCMFAVWAVLLVSFENQASGTVLGIPEFRKDFGEYYDGQYVINAAWQGAITGVPYAM
jgi:MFS transporter, SP family, general alpha glucoside:H+ symporter